MLDVQAGEYVYACEDADGLDWDAVLAACGMTDWAKARSRRSHILRAESSRMSPSMLTVRADGRRLSSTKSQAIQRGSLHLTAVGGVSHV